MKKEKIRKLFGKTFIKTGSMVLAAAVLVGSSMWVESRRIPIPELVSYVDMEEHIQVIEEEVPLVQPKVTTSVKTTKNTKKIKMNKESKKTYSKKGTTKKKTTTKKTSTAYATTTTKTEKATTVTSKFKKGSKIKTQLTTVKTTVTKTVVEKEKDAKDSVVNGSTAQKNHSVKTTSSETQISAGTYAVSAVAPKAERRVLEAYEKLGFKVVINPNVSYSGFFSAKDQLITLKKGDTTIYHELGHFLAFIAGNMDMSVDFKKVYNEEKSKYTAYNKAYVISSSSEYFAESYRNYVENPAALKAERPQTFAAMEEALSRITEDRIQKIWNVYSVLWNK